MGVALVLKGKGTLVVDMVIMETDSEVKVKLVAMKAANMEANMEAM